MYSFSALIFLHKVLPHQVLQPKPSHKIQSFPDHPAQSIPSFCLCMIHSQAVLNSLLLSIIQNFSDRFRTRIITND